MKHVAVFLFVCLCQCAKAQTCTGGLGDPIVNITFGQGAAPGPALANGITNLNFVAGGCPNDGQYAIVDHTSNCFGGTWLNVQQDHTGDRGGYFMLVNASYDPNDFYVQTINNLCGGTNYQFAAWILNMAIPTDRIRPNITFRIEKTDGTLLQTFATGDIPPVTSVQWNQYAFYFTTPPGISSVVIRIRNNAPGGIGNDVALDDITFRAAGPAIQTAIAGFASDTITLCESDLQTLHLSTIVEACFVKDIYQWQLSKDDGKVWADIPGAAGTTYDRSATVPGNYLYRLTVAEASNAGIGACRVASVPVMVNVVATPDPSITIKAASAAACVGLPVDFTAASTDGGSGVRYQWQVNGVDAGSGVSSFTTASLLNGDVVHCIMTSDAACVLHPVVFSNDLSLPVVPIPVTGVDISASADRICQDSVVSFTATPVNGGVSPSYVWSVNGATIGSQGPVYTTGGLRDKDQVICIMTGSLTCSQPVQAPEVVSMTVYPLPTAVLPVDTVIAGGTSIRLIPQLNGVIVYYQWSPAIGLDDPGAATPIASPLVTTLYQLRVETAEGCRAVTSEKVAVFYDVQLPGAFTPNGDGHNDRFRVPPAVPVHIRRLAVYNRVGAMLFWTSDVSNGWDGRLNGAEQPAGVYVWEIEYDNPVTRKVERKKGVVVLVR